jgi:hypothetical protein
MSAAPTGQSGQRISVVTGGAGARYAHFLAARLAALRVRAHQQAATYPRRQGSLSRR